MADELKQSLSITFQKGNGRKLEIAYGPKKITVSGTVSIQGMQVSVATSEEAIPLGEVTAAGALLIVKNMDDTNYVEIRDATGSSNDVVKLPAGEMAMFRFGSDVTAPYWIANTGACLVEYTLIPA